MYKLLLLTGILFGFHNVSAQVLTLTNQLNIPFDTNYIIARDGFKSGIAFDSEGNKIVVGSCSGKNVAFDASNMLSTGVEANGFIAKYNSKNEIIWIKNIGGSKHVDTHSSIDEVTDVLVDSENNIYILANVDLFVSDVIDLDPEHPVTNSIIKNEKLDPWDHAFRYYTDIILAKYSPEGTLLFYKEINGEYLVNSGYRLGFDQNNNILVTGTVGGNITFDFDKTKTYLDNHDIITYNDCTTPFIARFSRDGEFLNVKGIGGAGVVRQMNVHSEPSGNFYITGNYHSGSGLEFFINDATPYKTPKSMTMQDCGGEKEDIFIAKYNSSEKVQWAKTINSMLYDRATEILTDKNENVYVTGCFRGNSVDFDLDNTLAYDTKTSASGGTAFIAKYEPVNGKLVWLKTIEGGSGSEALTMFIKGDKIVVGGQFQGNVSLGNLSLNSTETNPFIAIIDTDGNWETAKKVDQQKSSAISKVKIAPDGTIHFLGYEIGITNFSGLRNLEVKGLFMGEGLFDKFLGTVTPETESAEEITFFPNPASDILYIKSFLNIEQLYLFDITGKLVLSQSGTKQINIKNLPKGIYFVKVRTDSGKVYTKRILKE
ncbi:T9SS type A sorting domain-containing protein [Flavobacterium chungangense]|nr:T9SS type A sorting domain-containing protein [Flavobacterium chungangense]